MSRTTQISWCHSTFNAWIGCTMVSAGCANCYAETQDRFRHWTPEGWGQGKPRKRTSVANWRQPLKWDKEASATIERIKHDIGNASEYNPIDYERPRIFCGSLMDWLDDEVPAEWLADLLRLIHNTRNLDWLLLTKRPENFLPRMDAALKNLKGIENIQLGCSICNWIAGHPWSNVWLGTTVENQEMAELRIPKLLAIPARVRFLSCEPLLGPVDIISTLCGPVCDKYIEHGDPVPLDWLICGGESGPHARPMHPGWARSLRDQCAKAGVPFFFKQWGEWLPGCQYQEGDLAKFHEKAQHSWDLDNHSWWVGKKLSGHFLDACEHHEFPTP